jgi:hypothetical protein
MLRQEAANNAQYQLDALEVAPQRPVNSQGRVQRMAAARIPNQRDVHMGRGDDVREAATNALAACQQHAKDTAELVAKAVRNLQKGEETFTQGRQKLGLLQWRNSLHLVRIVCSPVMTTFESFTYKNKENFIIYTWH